MATVASDGPIHHRNSARKMTGFGLTRPVLPRPDANGALNIRDNGGGVEGHTNLVTTRRRQSHPNPTGNVRIQVRRSDHSRYQVLSAVLT